MLQMATTACGRRLTGTVSAQYRGVEGAGCENFYQMSVEMNKEINIPIFSAAGLNGR